MIPATIGTAMYKLLKHSRVRAYTYSKVLGVDRAAIMASGKQVVEHLNRMEKEGLLSSKFKAFCKWVFTYPVLEEMFQTMVSSKTGHLTDDVKDVRALIKTLPRASYSSHAGQRSYVSSVLPACLLSTKSKAVETPILVSGADMMDEELMGNDGSASHSEARYSATRSPDSFMLLQMNSKASRARPCPWSPVPKAPTAVTAVPAAVTRATATPSRASGKRPGPRPRACGPQSRAGHPGPTVVKLNVLPTRRNLNSLG